MHTDKTLYNYNETIWFSAYFIEDMFVKPEGYKVLTISLVGYDGDIRLRGNYKVADGLSFGSFEIPDSISPGNYQLLATTDFKGIDGKPSAVFQQAITIKSGAQQHFDTSISLLDSAIVNGAVRAMVSVDFKGHHPKEDPVIEYTWGKNVWHSDRIRQGRIIISLPQDELSPESQVFYASIKHNGETQFVSIRLPQPIGNGINVKFFPEGERLVDGMENLLALEIKDNRDQPLALTGTLYMDEVPVDTLKTNGHGIGTFKLKPEGKSDYMLKLGKSGPPQLDNKVYALPKAIDRGLVLHIPDAVVGDTLPVYLNSMETRDVQVLVHDYQDVFTFWKGKVPSPGLKLTIALDDVPKGVTNVSVVDGGGKLLVERLFFAHHDRSVDVDVHPDKDVYGKREVVKVKLKLQHSSGNPLKGIISTAVVLESRIEEHHFQDIESYMLLESRLGTLPHYRSDRRIDNRNYIEHLLLTESWPPDNRQDLTGSEKAIDDSPKILPVFEGKVTYKNKKLRRPVEVSMVTNSSYKLFATSNDGTFYLSSDDLLVDEGEQVSLFVNKKDRQGYAIEVGDPFLRQNQFLANNFFHWPKERFQANSISSIGRDAASEGVIQLKEVNINANRESGVMDGGRGKPGTNECGDYVDEFDYLNYAGSAGSKNIYQPIRGKQYKIRTDLGDGYFKVSPIIYKGCLTEKHKTVFEIDGIYGRAREFLGVAPDGSEPQHLTTLFWKAGIIVNPYGEVELELVTGDIPGQYRIIVQGVSENGPLFGQASFIVNE